MWSEKWVTQLSAAASQVGKAALAWPPGCFAVGTEGPSFRDEVSAPRVTDDKKCQRISEPAFGSSGPMCGLKVFIGNTAGSLLQTSDQMPSADFLFLRFGPQGTYVLP